MGLRSFTTPQLSFTPGSARLLQRKCACGGTPGPTSECAECRNKRLGLRRKATNRAATPSVPSVVHEVLRSPGRPLDPAAPDASDRPGAQSVSRSMLRPAHRRRLPVR